MLAASFFHLSASATQSCPAVNGSMHKAQLAFMWEGSSATYAGSSTLAIHAAPLKPIGEHKARIPEASDARANQAFLIDGADGSPPERVHGQDTLELAEVPV